MGCGVKSRNPSLKENVILNIICINAGNYLGRGSEYVNILADMVARNISKETAYKFICFTDNPENLDIEIDARPLPENLEGWWNKLALFKEGLFPDGDRILYLDLDTIITSGLDEIIKYKGEFAILRDFYRTDGLQSSVMAWEANTQAHIWEWWVKAGKPLLNGGDQEWIEESLYRVDKWQDLYPDSFVSYKVHARKEIPANAKMVIFHGQPRPHEVTTGWMPHIWKIGGGSVMELTQVCNTDDSVITKNIKSALGQNHKWLQMAAPHDGHAVIVGGAPSLKFNLKEIELRQQNNQIIFATNNAFNYLRANGIKPEVHVMLDAREENIEFVPQRGNTQCYYSSQCHPDVIKEASKHDLILWHPMIESIFEIIGNDTGDALVGGGSTVGMKAIALAYILGYRKFHLYGMDSSYSEGENHAYKQPLNDSEKVIEVTMNGSKYQSAPWMCTQVEDFKITARELVQQGCVLTVHGNGLLPDVAQNLSIPIPAAQVRANEILSRLNGEVVGAEIGVFLGALSMRLLTNPNITLYMVDSWTTSPDDGQYAKSGDFHANLTQEQQNQHFGNAVLNTAFAGDRAKILRKSSVDAAKDMPDASLDFVFIDADHSYEGCRQDIEAWLPKLKSGGLLSGHDYKNTEYPCFGVDKAVDEFVDKTGYELELGDNFTWFIRLQ